MQRRTFGKLGEISALTLGGGGIGQVWGPTTQEEAVATVREAVEAGVTFFDGRNFSVRSRRCVGSLFLSFLRISHVYCHRHREAGKWIWPVGGVARPIFGATSPTTNLSWGT